VPAAPINLRKSLRDNPSDVFVSTADIQAEILDKLVINLVRFLDIFCLKINKRDVWIAIPTIIPTIIPIKSPRLTLEIKPIFETVRQNYWISD